MSIDCEDLTVQILTLQQKSMMKLHRALEASAGERLDMVLEMLVQKV